MTIQFSFDGRSYTGQQGDTLAAALIRSGVHLMGRSFKYHRPRGPLSAGPEEPNALVQVSRDAARTTPNLRATVVELYDGLVAESQNRWPSLRRDVGAVNQAVAPVLSAGFYYKTFMWPRGAWERVYEPVIRRAAGLGEAPALPDPDRYATRFAHCEVLVVGSGPAGLAAALAASAAPDVRVMLCDEQAAFGGSLLAEQQAQIGGMAAREWVGHALKTLFSRPNVTLLPRTTAFGYYQQNMLGLVERVTDHLADPDPMLPRERLWQVRAGRVVIAAGALERPLVFPDNDRPGIMLADSARTYATRYGAVPGQRAVIATACDTAYQAALDLAEAGLEVALVADLRQQPEGALVDQLRQAGIPVATGATVLGSTGGRGGWRVRTALVEVGGRVRRIGCDLLLMSGGWTPSIHLSSQSRAKPRFDARLGAYLPGEPVQAEASAGACRGVFGLAEALADGARTGMEAARWAGHEVALPEMLAVTGAPVAEGWALGLVPGASARHAFVDFQNDVTAADLQLAVQEGFRSIEHVKRYTTTGMATDQGKTSNLNTIAIVAEATGQGLPQVGLTTFRTPVTPVTFGALAGHSRGALFDPVRTTPLHGWADAQGAVFEDVALWKRARYFPRDGEDMYAAVARECLTVRRRVGLFDASTLGKIEVAGPDAAEFLNRFYTASWTKLGVGRCRYGLALREAGFVFDDGVIGRIAEDRFHVTTTTGGAPRVLGMMEDYLQTEWPELRAWLTSTTEEWAVIAVQGPRARAVLDGIVQCDDLGTMPHMSVRACTALGVPARLFRVSFSGELGFELNVAPDYAAAVWDAVWARVEGEGGCAYGTEAMHVLRAEKGYIIVGQETDGTATPDDAGLGWAIGKGKPDFVGKRSLSLPALAAGGRPQLVGLLAVDGSALDEGAQVTAEAGARAAIGWVTSAYPVSSLGHPIALAMVEDGWARLGGQAWVQRPGGAVRVEISSPVFYDPKGARLDA